VFRVFSFLVLLLLSCLAYGQSDEFVPAEESAPSDELVTEGPQEESASEPELQIQSSPPSDSEAPSADAVSPAPEEQLVLIRERVESAEPQGSDQLGLVELRGSQDIFLPYKQRQKPWGYIFSLGAELVTYPGLLSQFTEADGSIATFEDLFGANSQTMPSFEMGPKYNTSIGSFAFLLGYSRLDISSSRIGSEAQLRISRYTANLVYYLDTIWEEPYFVPYIGAGAWQADYEEENEDEPGITAKYTTDVGFQWRIGGLIGLDWIEPATALRSRKTLGLQSTFLNLYATSSYMSESDPDPDLENELDFGASLVVEF